MPKDLPICKKRGLSDYDIMATAAMLTVIGVKRCVGH
jgi:hypothetical protein